MPTSQWMPVLACTSLTIGTRAVGMPSTCPQIHYKLSIVMTCDFLLLLTATASHHMLKYAQSVMCVCVLLIP